MTTFSITPRHPCLTGWMAMALWILTTSTISLGAPFLNRTISVRQPDGSVVQLIGTGDELHAEFTTVDEYTVVREPTTKRYCYAVRSPDQRSLQSSGIPVSENTRPPNDLDKRLGYPANQVQEQVAQRYEQLILPRRCESRRRAGRDHTTSGARSPPSRATIGTFRGLTILIDFADDPAAIPRDEVERFCNQPGYGGYGNNGSVYDYFVDNSLGLLQYTNVVTSYYRATNHKTYYADENVPFGQRAQELIVETLQALRDGGFDPASLSSDSEGNIYALNVLYVGDVPNFWAEGLWPHATALATPFSLGGGKTISDYQITNMGDELTLYTFCHENGHMICDYPDLYDYGSESLGVGNFCLMGFGGDERNPVQICAYLKFKSGWAGAVTDLGFQFGRFEATTDANEFFIHRLHATEYFILENRYRSGRDAALPASGLAIWHVDEEFGSNDLEFGAPEAHYECALIQADALYNLELANNPGDFRDLFSAQSNVSFNATTQPGAFWWDGTPADLRLHSIDEPGPTIAFTAVSPDVPYVVGISSEDPDGLYSVGELITLMVQFNHPVIVTGAPELLLDLGTDVVAAQYDSGSGSDTLAFEYQITAEHASPDLEYIGTTALVTPSGSIRTSGNMAADLTLPAPGGFGSISYHNEFEIDAGSLQVTIGPPSLTATRTMPVTFEIQYHDANVIRLHGSNVLLSTTGTAQGEVTAVSGFGVNHRYITVSSISGSGTLRVAVRAGTAFSDDGRAATATEFSALVNVNAQSGPQVDPVLHVQTWGVRGHRDGQLDGPEGIAANSAGDVYVSESRNQRLQKFGGNGTFITTWGHRGSGNGEFGAPAGIAARAATGELYVADSANHRVQMFSFRGDYLGQWGGPGAALGEFLYPGGIAVAPDGSVYVADQANHRVQMFDPLGHFLLAWGAIGVAPGAFLLPVDVAADRFGNIYVVDQENHRVQKCTADGQPLAVWGGRGGGDGQFEYPAAVAIDSKDRVYVVDHNFSRVQVFDANGFYLTTFGGPGVANGKFYGPRDVAVDDGGMIHVADTKLNRIQSFLPETRVSIATQQAWTTAREIDYSVRLWSTVPQVTKPMFTVANGDIVNVSGNGKSFTLTIMARAEGNVTCQLPSAVVVSGGRANAASNIATVRYDVTPPAVTLSSTTPSHTKTTPIAATIRFSESIIQFPPERLALQNAHLPSLTRVAPLEYELTVMPISDGDVRITVPAGAVADLAGNTNTAPIDLARRFDTTPPVVIVHTPDPQATNHGPAQFTIQLSEASEVEMTTTDIMIYRAGTASHTNQQLIREDADTWVLTLSGITGNGTIRIQLAAAAARDLAGNSSTISALSPVLVADNTIPAPPDQLRLHPSDDSGLSSSDGITRVASGLSFLGVAESGSTVRLYGGTTLLALGSADSFALNGIDLTLTDGLHSMQATATDLAGNESALSAPVSVTIDRVSPHVILVQPGPGTQLASPLGPLTFTFNELAYGNSGTIRVRSGVDGRLREEIPVSASAVQIDNRQSGGTMVTVQRSIRLTSAHANYYVELDSGMFVDVAGNGFAGILNPTAWTLIPNAAVDADEDGLDDRWETDFFTDLGQSGETDGDGDGRSVLDEYRDGTNPLVYDLILRAGWNLLSFARTPLDPASGGFLTRHNPYGNCCASPLWSWQAGKFRQFAQVEAGRGYWLYSPYQTLLVIPTNTEVGSVVRQEGWNLIGVFDPIDVDQLLNRLGAVWRWDVNRYIITDELRRSVGYWVYHRSEAP